MPSLQECIARNTTICGLPDSLKSLADIAGPGVSQIDIHVAFGSRINLSFIQVFASFTTLAALTLALTGLLLSFDVYNFFTCQKG